MTDHFHALLWIDHREAKVFQFNAMDVDCTTIRSRPMIACIIRRIDEPIASLIYLLTSHVWRQDHNAFSHQDRGSIELVANKKSDVVGIYLPPDANCLLSVADHRCAAVIALTR